MDIDGGRDKRDEHDNEDAVEKKGNKNTPFINFGQSHLLMSLPSCRKY